MTSFSENIKKAIGNHGIWKAKLKQIIETGQTPEPIEIIISDKNCDFGKWLNSLTPPITNSPEYTKVKELHTKFHSHAAEIAGLASSGKKDDAKRLLAIGGSFELTSSKMTKALLEWADKS